MVVSEAQVERDASGGGFWQVLEQSHADVGRWVRAELSAVEREVASRAGWAPAPACDAAIALLGAGGKRVRAIATLLSARAASPLSVVPEHTRRLAAAAELVHAATLLHDDVIDEATTRRGAPAARMLHGNAMSVLAGDGLLVAALGTVTSVDSGDALGDLLATLSELVGGEVLQLNARRDLIVDREHYFRVIRAKTASLFGWCCRAGARSAGADPTVTNALGEFGARTGVAFQLQDDALDVSGSESDLGKSAWVDLREGKATLPVVVAVERGEATHGLVRDAAQGKPGAVAQLARAVRRSGGIDEANRLAGAETRAALRALEAVPASTARDALELLAWSLLGRRG